MRRAHATLVTTAALLLAVGPALPAASAGADSDVPLVALTWDGSTTTDRQQSFVGVPVTVPGDRAGRTLTVRNDGPVDGTVRAWVTQVDLREPSAGADDAFYDDLRLEWETASQSRRASFRTLADAGDTLITRTHLPRGATTRLDLAYVLPDATTSGNRAAVGPREASFVVRVQIAGGAATGAEAVQPQDGAVVMTSPTDLVAAFDPDTGVVGHTAGLAHTGVDILRAALFAVVAIGLGSLVLGPARRRRDVQNPGTSGSTPSAR